MTMFMKEKSRKRQKLTRPTLMLLREVKLRGTSNKRKFLALYCVHVGFSQLNFNKYPKPEKEYDKRQSIMSED